MSVDQEHWSRIAAEWLARARTPNHDAFWAYRNPLVAFIGRGAGEALDVGCGEGRVSRVLRNCGYQGTATDPVEAFVSAAEQAGSADEYRVAAAANLPFAELVNAPDQVFVRRDQVDAGGDLSLRTF
jgi:SAM-dependent methyltransferase